MIALDEEALICDLAETYHIYNYEELPPELVATLSLGLGQNSRIKSKMNGIRVPMDTFLFALIADALRTLVWMQTKDGHKGNKRPQSLAEEMLIATKKPTKRTYKVSTMADFARRYEKKYGRKING